MPIFHLCAKVIGRADGRSATGAAAYRAGEKITDERTGIVFDFSKKRGVDHKEILAPDNAPPWALDRAKLWNAVEHSEKRKDSQLAREIEVSIPVELNREQMLELVRRFAQEQFVALGMIADINYHDLTTHNPHSHIQLTTRDIGPDGFGKKNRDWNSKDLLEQWREKWAEHANRALEKAGIEARIDHRTLEAQGVTDRAPGIHLGPSATGVVRRNEKSEVAERAKQRTDEFLARVQADAAIQIAAERDVKELESQLETLLAEIANQEKTQEPENVYFTHSKKPNTRRPGGLSTHSLRVLSECHLAPNSSDSGEGAENSNLLHTDERPDRPGSDRMRRMPEPADNVSSVETARDKLEFLASVSNAETVQSLRDKIDEYQSLHLAGSLEARQIAMEARGRAHRRDVVEAAHKSFTHATREHRRAASVIKIKEDEISQLPIWRPFKKSALKKELEEARRRLDEQVLAIDKNRDLARAPILDKCDDAIRAADADITAAEAELEPLVRELEALEQQSAALQAARLAEAQRLEEEIRRRRDEERARAHAVMVEATRDSPAYQAEQKRRRDAAEAEASRVHSTGPK